MRAFKNINTSFLSYTTAMDSGSFTEMRTPEVTGNEFTPLVLDTLSLRCV